MGPSSDIAAGQSSESKGTYTGQVQDGQLLTEEAGELMKPSSGSIWGEVVLANDKQRSFPD